jgi:hypothetical protein
MRIENYREKGEREKREFKRMVGLVLTIATVGIYLALDRFPLPTGIIFLIGLYLYGNNDDEEFTVHLITTFDTQDIFTEKKLYDILDKYEKEIFKKKLNTDSLYTPLLAE